MFSWIIYPERCWWFILYINITSNTYIISYRFVHIIDNNGDGWRRCGYGVLRPILPRTPISGPGDYRFKRNWIYVLSAVESCRFFSYLFPPIRSRVHFTEKKKKGKTIPTCRKRTTTWIPIAILTPGQFFRCIGPDTWRTLQYK